MRAAIAAGVFLLAAALPALAQQNSPPMKAAPITSNDAVKWGPAPAVLPAGAQLAVLDGDPSQAAPFTIRLRFPDGYRVPPHFHPTEEHVTVLEGTFLAAMGDTFSDDALNTFKPGGFVTMPANVHHYARAQGTTIVQIQAMGPFQLTYVNAADDPSKKSQ